MKKKVLIGGAWPYANNSLHIGHLAALLPGDIIARYYRGNGDEVIYVSGTDSHGTPITNRAKEEGISPKQIVDVYHEEFANNFKSLGFTYDLYTATMSEDHKQKVQEYFLKILENGYIFEKEEEQDFCETCNDYLSDREIIGVCPHCSGKAKGDQCDDCLRPLSANEIVDKSCKSCGKETIMKKNKHLYFKLSAFQDVLFKYINDKNNIWRKNALNESKKFLEMGLIDRAATRHLDWGVEVPVDGYDDKRIYVWIEAVLGYLTAASAVASQKNIDFEEYIKADNYVSYFVHGKDNIPFHSIIYPALLKAIDKEYKLPTYIISCEYINMNNEKMSKSVGNLVRISDLAATYEADTIRYYMIANGPEKKDVNFSDEDLIQIHNKFLVGVLGNFVNRNLSFINNKFEGVIKHANIDENIQNKTEELYKIVGNLIEKGELRLALENVMNYVVAGNKYYDEETPWIKVKEDIDKFNDITYTCIYMIANISNLIAPFLPNTSSKIKNILSLDEFSWEPININGDIKINNLEILFNRIDNRN